MQLKRVVLYCIVLYCIVLYYNVPLPRRFRPGQRFLLRNILERDLKKPIVLYCIVSYCVVLYGIVI